MWFYIEKFLSTLDCNYTESTTQQWVFSLVRLKWKEIYAAYPWLFSPPGLLELVGNWWWLSFWLCHQWQPKNIGWDKSRPVNWTLCSSCLITLFLCCDIENIIISISFREEILVACRESEFNHSLSSSGSWKFSSRREADSLSSS